MISVWVIDISAQNLLPNALKCVDNGLKDGMVNYARILSNCIPHVLTQGYYGLVIIAWPPQKLHHFGNNLFLWSHSIFDI